MNYRFFLCQFLLILFLLCVHLMEVTINWLTFYCWFGEALVGDLRLNEDGSFWSFLIFSNFGRRIRDLPFVCSPYGSYHYLTYLRWCRILAGKLEILMTLPHFFLPLVHLLKITITINWPIFIGRCPFSSQQFPIEPGRLKATAHISSWNSSIKAENLGIFSDPS